MRTGIRLLSTRKLDDSQKAELTSKGFVVDDREMVKVEYIMNDELKMAVSKNTAPYVFTSIHSVLSLEMNSLVPASKGSAYCIAGRTSDKVKDLGYNILGTGWPALGGSLSHLGSCLGGNAL